MEEVVDDVGGEDEVDDCEGSEGCFGEGDGGGGGGEAADVGCLGVEGCCCAREDGGEG